MKAALRPLEYRSGDHQSYQRLLEAEFEAHRAHPFNRSVIQVSTVFVDYPFTCESRDPEARRVGRRHGHRWSHMWSEDLEALHDLAARIGMRREWFQNRPGFPHYDLVPTRRARAIQLGAVEMDLMTWLREKRDRNGTGQ